MNLQTTIMIAAYNAARFLPKSIASARAQTGLTPEIIVADDASKDETPQIMREFPDVRYIQMSQNGGPSVARNAAIEAATGDWIAVLDADDDMVPGRLSTMLGHALAADADIVLGNFTRVDIHGVPVNGGVFLPPSEIDPLHHLTLENYLSGNQMTAGEKCLGYLKPIFRREYLMETGLRYDPALRNSEDYHIIAAAIAEGAKVIISPEPDYLYQQAEGSLSATVPPKYIEALLAADAEFAAKVLAPGADTRTERLAQLIEIRRIHLETLMAAEVVMTQLKNRKIMAAGKLCASNARARKLVMTKLSEAVRKRLPGG